MNRRTLLAGVLATASFFCCWRTSHAQAVEHGRGKIVSIDFERQRVVLRDPKDQEASWRFRSDASVKFSDGAASFPDPSVRDLRPPMYVHYMFRDRVIVSFDVVELGFQPGTQSNLSSLRQPGTPRTVVGRVTAYDPEVRQVAVDHDGVTEAFQLTERTDRRLEAGERVELHTEWSGRRELVTELRVLPGSGPRHPGRDERRGERRGDRGPGKE
jgi:hypothetical protein